MAKREYIDSVWICDYCNKVLDGKNLGFKKEGYCLCKDCKHMSIDAIRRKKGIL